MSVPSPSALFAAAETDRAVSEQRLPVAIGNEMKRGSRGRGPGGAPVFRPHAAQLLFPREDPAPGAGQLLFLSPSQITTMAGHSAKIKAATDRSSTRPLQRPTPPPASEDAPETEPVSS